MEETKTTLFQRALDNVEAGRSGLNKGIPISFPRLRMHLPDIQQETYYLTGAAAKCGKTAFTDDLFLYGTYDWIIANKDKTDIVLDIDYFSFEINSVSKITKGIARRLWKDYGIIVDVNEILSRGKNHCSDELYNLIIGYRRYFEEMEDILTILDFAENPTGIRNYLLDKARKRGKIIEKNINRDPNGPPIMRFDKYIPNNPNIYWIIILDHCGIMKEERGFTTKQNIDKMSQYLIDIRNNYKGIPVVIQQLAFDSENDERHKSGRLTPTLKDFGDSKYTTRKNSIKYTIFQ